MSHRFVPYFYLSIISHFNKCHELIVCYLYLYFWNSYEIQIGKWVKYRIIAPSRYWLRWRWHKEVMTMTRWYNDDDAIAMVKRHDDAIARSFIVSQSSSSLCYIFAMVPSHQRHRTIKSSLHRSRPRWCDSDLVGHTRIPYFFFE